MFEVAFTAALVLLLLLLLLQPELWQLSAGWWQPQHAGPGRRWWGVELGLER
jgi:hypothetical protein